MDWDLILTLGIVLVVLSVPSLLAAWVDGRVPRLGAVMLVAGAGMIVTAVIYTPTGYRLVDVPGVVIGVAARLLN